MIWFWLLKLYNKECSLIARLIEPESAVFSALAVCHAPVPMQPNRFGKSMLPKKKRELTAAQREKLSAQLAKGRKTQGF